MKRKHDVVSRQLDVLRCLGDVLDGLAGILASWMEPVCVGALAVPGPVRVVALGGKQLVRVVRGRGEDGADHEAKHLDV